MSGCGKPTYNGQPDDFCSKACKANGPAASTAQASQVHAASYGAQDPEQYAPSMVYAMLKLAKEGDWPACLKMLSGNDGLVNERPHGANWGVIHRAASENNVDILRELVGDLDADIMFLSGNKKTALQLAEAAGASCAEAAQYLREEMTSSSVAPKALELFECAKQRRWQQAYELLTSHPAVVNCIPDGQSFSALHMAAHQGKLGVVQLLVEEYGADPNVLDVNGHSPLETAKACKHAEVIRFLAAVADAGVRKEAVAKRVVFERDEDEPAESEEAEEEAEEESEKEPHEAAFAEADLASRMKDWPAMFAALERAGANYVNMRMPGREWAILHQAAAAGDVDVLKRLVQDFKADPALPTAGRRTELPEDIARRFRHKDAVEYLRDAAAAHY